MKKGGFFHGLFNLILIQHKKKKTTTSKLCHYSFPQKIQLKCSGCVIKGICHNSGIKGAYTAVSPNMSKV